MITLYISILHRDPDHRESIPTAADIADIEVKTGWKLTPETFGWPEEPQPTNSFLADMADTDPFVTQLNFARSVERFIEGTCWQAIAEMP